MQKKFIGGAACNIHKRNCVLLMLFVTVAAMFLFIARHETLCYILSYL
jgi:hypothetical protein